MSTCYSSGTFKELGLAGACLIARSDRYPYALASLLYDVLNPGAVSFALLLLCLLLPKLVTGTDSIQLQKNGVYTIFFADMGIHVSFLWIVCAAFGLTQATYPCACYSNATGVAIPLTAQTLFPGNFLLDPMLVCTVFVGISVIGFMNIFVGVALLLVGIGVTFVVGASSILTALISVCVSVIAALEFFFAPFGVRFLVLALSIALFVTTLCLSEANNAATVGWATDAFLVHCILWAILLLSVPREKLGRFPSISVQGYADALVNIPHTITDCEQDDNSDSNTQLIMSRFALVPSFNSLGLAEYAVSRAPWARTILLGAIVVAVLLMSVVRLYKI